MLGDQQLSGNAGQLDRREGGIVRFLARTGLMAGRRFSLHDVDRREGRIRKVPLESIDATHRVFVQADGGRFLYSFAKGERRELTASALERQLQAATYTMRDPARGNPR